MRCARIAAKLRERDEQYFDHMRRGMYTPAAFTARLFRDATGAAGRVIWNQRLAWARLYAYYHGEDCP